MQEAVDVLNEVATALTAAFGNTAFVALGAAAVTGLAAASKALNAASRYLLSWIALVTIIATPFMAGLMPRRVVLQDAIPPAAITFVHSAAAFHEQAGRAAAIAPHPPAMSWESVVLICWLAAAIVQLVRVFRSFLYGLELKGAAEAAPEDLVRVFNRLCEQSGVRRRVRLSLCRSISSPAVAGYLHPQILLPADLVQALGECEMAQVLTHEITHVKRFDDWAVALQRVIEAVYVFHPLVWFLSRRLNLDREMACDDAVRATHEAASYAECLAKVAGVSCGAPEATVLVPLFERKSELLARVEMLLDRTRAHVPRISVARVMTGCALLLCLSAVALRSPRLVAARAFQDGATAHARGPEQKVYPETSAAADKDGITSIIVSSKAGANSIFGEWSSETQARQSREPDTIQFRSGGRLYMIRDKATVAKAQNIIKPIEELGRTQGQLGEEQAKLGEEQAKLGEQQRLMSERHLDVAAQAQLRARLGEVKKRADELNGQTPQEVQAQLAALQAQLAEMQAQMGSEQSKIGAEQSRLASAQSALGEQQAALGTRQEALGRQQAALSKTAEKQLTGLIRDAQAHGLAQPME